VTQRHSLPLLTQSEMRSFRRCARERYYSYVLGRRHRVGAEPLTFGRFVHAGLQSLWTTDGVVDNAPPPSDPFKRETARVLLAGYVARWGKPEGSLGAEIEFVAPLINPETGAESRTFALGGKLDAMARICGRDWIVEHKTSSEDISAGSDYWKRLRIDTQISTYYVGAKALGYSPFGVLYDVIRKPTIRPRNTDTPESWGARLVGDIATRPEFYFQRGEVVRLESEQRDAALDAWQTARNIAEADKLSRHPRNADACVRWGRTCDYFGVCTGTESIEDDYLFETKKTKHEELSK